jgi:C-22 sterol desaturase
MASLLRQYSVSPSVPSFTSPPHLNPISYPSPSHWLFTTAFIVLSLLVLEQSIWRFKKRHLPGDTWTIPIIGRFSDSMHPTMEHYKKQWDSGALSALSVFNVY